MNNLGSQFIDALQRMLASPATQSADAGLKTQIQLAERVARRMLAEDRHGAAVRLEALRDYGTAATRAQRLFAANGVPTVDAAALAALAARRAPEDFDAALRIARAVMFELAAFRDEEARSLRREFVRIEHHYSANIDKAFLALANTSSDASGAINTRQIDEARFNRFLATAFPREPDIHLEGYEFIIGGHSKYTALLTLGGVRELPRNVVMRGDGSGQFGGVSVTDEFRIIKAVYQHGVKVATPLAVDESGTVFGAPIMLVEQVPGGSIGHMFKLPAPDIEVCRDTAVQLARMHRVPLEALEHAAPGFHVSNRDKTLGWLDESYASFKGADWVSPIYETAFRWLRENVHLTEGARSLVHGDYGLNNVLIHEHRVSAILDWEFVHVGCPFYDLGYFYFQAQALDSWDTFYEAYLGAGGFEVTPEQLDYAILFAATRLGVMTCQSIVLFNQDHIRGAAAAQAATGFHDDSIIRMAGVLERVL